ncbi:hypothetical protein M9H77_13186 [Catharanthus roseus]|uniref:Uncharacterized protein n=1 Tax=Catharanthus roseus TaxID=4058 RepID=A0ACC0BJQ8_CATRO|nr:hypothetical protein M9H77_13186 [Catharanthus roseus]
MCRRYIRDKRTEELTKRIFIRDLSCIRQKLVPRTVRRPSPTPAVRVRFRSTNTKKILFTQRLPLCSKLHMGKERCYLRGLDHSHGPTSHSICRNLTRPEAAKNVMSKGPRRIQESKE